MALVNDIIAAHASRDIVYPGELLKVDVDRVYVQDGNSPTIARLFTEHGFDRVFNPEAVGVFFDHSVIAPDRRIADRLQEAMAFARNLGVQVFREGAGISHVLALDNGWYEPGGIVVGADSHTCTGGAVQCLGLGMGASDVAAAMVTGRTWLRVPQTVWLDVSGVPEQATRPKDVMLYLLSKFGQSPFLYRSVELGGNWVNSLSLDGAATVASLGVELGAKNVFLPDGKDRPEGMKPLIPDPGGSVMECDISGLPPMIAKPHSPSNVVPVNTLRGQEIDYVFIGSCTNSRLEDISEVANVLKGQTIHSSVYCMVTPGSREIYLEAVHRGYIESICRAGAVVTPPGCGACVGTQGSIPGSGARVLSTMNRNFLGRMGNPEAEIYLGSPLVAAHTAIRGVIPPAEELLSDG